MRTFTASLTAAALAACTLSSALQSSLPISSPATIISATSAELYPFLVNIHVNSPSSNYHTCTGALITSLYILTSASCLIDPISQSAYPPVSTYVFTHPGTAQATVENALEILISPKYNSRTLSNNYALVKIGGAGSDAMKLSTTIKLQSNASVMAKGTEVVNIGCDANDNCESVKRRIVDGERCKAAGTESGSSSLCTTSTVEAVSPPSPQCIANSGIEPSDLLVYTDPSTKKPALVGIASYSTTAFSQSSSASPLLPKSTCGSDADRLLHYTSIESIINDIAQQLGTTAEVLTASAESTDHSNTTTTAKPTSANEDDSGSTSGGGSSNGLAIGFGIGGGVLVLAGIALIFYYRRMERHRGYQRERLAQFTIVPASVDRLSSASTASVTAMSPSLLNVKSMASSTPRYAMRATPYSSYA